MKKLNELRDLPVDFILYTIDVVGLYPNIPHKEGLEPIRKALDKREDQTISTDSLILLTVCVLKNSVFKHDMRYFKQLNGTAIGTKIAPPYAVLFMGYLEDKILNSLVERALVWWRYIDDMFMIWQHGEETLKEFHIIYQIIYFPHITFIYYKNIQIYSINIFLILNNKIHIGF